MVTDIIGDAGGTRLELRRRGTSIESLLARTSGGITLKTERLEIDRWLGVLAGMLAAEARASAQTREALARMLDTV